MQLVLRTFGPVFSVVAGLSGALNLLALSGSFFMLMVYDRVLPSHSVPTLVGLVAIVTTVYLFQGLLDTMRSRLLVEVGGAFDRSLSGDVYDAMTAQALYAPGSDPLQPIRDLDAVRAFVSGPGPTSLFDLPWMVIYLGICFAFHWLIGVTTLAGALVLIGLTVVNDRLTREPSRQATRLGSLRFQLASASAQSVEVISTLGMANRIKDRWVRANEQFRTGQSGAAAMASGFSAFTRVFRMFLQSGVLAVGAYLVIQEKATGGIIIASSILTSRALAPIELAIGNWRAFVGARQAWERLDTLLLGGPAAARLQLPPPTRTLSVESIALIPPGTAAENVSDVSFTLSAGDGLAIVGPSGSGKSSLVRGLVGAWSPVRGCVRLDGAALDQWSPDALGRHIGYLPQSVELIAGTVAENISRFEEEASSRAVIAAAMAAGVHELILSFPKGYETSVGPGGASLSAGQRQRIALARALYRDPFLIVLDEPNSNVDAEGEAALTSALVDARHRGAIVVLVAHRPASLESVDKVLVMAAGRVRMFGPKAEVLSKIVTRAPRPAAGSGALQVMSGNKPA